MADNVTTQTTVSTVPSGTVIATDDVAGAHYQVVKLALGLNSAVDTHLDSGQQAMANSVPVTIASDQSDVKITLDGETVAISGTVSVQSNSANLATEATAALIRTAVETIDNAIAGSEMQVDIVSGGPIGATTDAEAAADGSVIAILKRLRTLLGGTLTISGSVTVGAALPAGTNNIGDVDVLSVVPGTGATNLGKAEDAAHTTADVGVMALGVRQDADASLADTTGDYVPMQFDDNGFLKVNIKAGAGSGGTASTDDAAFTAAAGSGTPIMGFVTANSVDSGDVGVIGMLANRQLKVTLYDSGGVELAVGGGTQYTEDAAAAANPVGNAMILVREDARAGSLTTTDGDNVAARGNNRGELYVKTTDSDALLTTIDADTSTLAGAVAGTEMQVDVVAALPAGDNNIGNVDLASAIPAGTNNIGDVDVLTLPALPAGNNNIGDVDVASIAAGDNNIGNVDIVTMPNVTIGTMANLTESLADDAAFTPATSRVLPAGFTFDDDTPDSVNEGDIGAARMSANRNIYTTLRDAAGNERGVNVTAGNALTVDGSAATQPVSAASLPLPTGAATAANQTTVIGHLDGVEGLLTTIDGDTGTIAGAVTGTEMQVDVVAALPAGDNNIGNVDLASAIPAGTNNIGDVDVLTLPALPAGNNNIGNVDIASIAAGDNNIGNVDVVTMPGVVGTVADDGTTPGNPVMIGGKAVETDGTDPTSVSAEDDVAILRTDRNRRLLVSTVHPRMWVARENHTTAQTNNELQAAPGANLSLYITDIIMSTLTAATIKLVENTAGTPVDRAGPYHFAAYGGIAMPLVTPIRITPNTNLGFTGGATGDYTVEIHGYTAP